ncbi:MAG: MAPEG family protein [Pseudomonadota bacterium]
MWIMEISGSQTMFMQMTHIQIVAFYGALQLVLATMILLSVMVARVKSRVSIGDGGDENLIKAMRVQANFVENVPMVMIGLVLLGLLQVSVYTLHGFGALFFISRLPHFLGMGLGVFPPGRNLGSALNQLTLVATIIALFSAIFL